MTAEERLVEGFSLFFKEWGEFLVEFRSMDAKFNRLVRQTDSLQQSTETMLKTTEETIQRVNRIASTLRGLRSNS